MESIDRVKIWLGWIVFVFVLTLISDLTFVYRHGGVRKGDWVHSPNMSLKQGGKVLDNRSSETGIWIPAKDYELMQRGSPHWVLSGITLLAIIGMYRSLNRINAKTNPISKGDSSPRPPTGVSTEPDD